MDKKINGKTIKKHDNYTTKIVTIKYLQDIENEIFIIPDFQRILDPNKITSMLLEPDEFFNFITNPLQFVWLKNKDISIFYLIDGQHRYNTFKKKYEITKINYEILINIIECDNIDKILHLYNKINYDNPNIIKFEDVTKYVNERKYLHFRKKLNDEMSDYFKSLKNVYGLEEYILCLRDLNYLDKFITLDNALDFLIENNKMYYNLFYNKKDCKYKKKEEEFIIDHYVLALKNNNFLDFLFTNDDCKNTFIFYHKK